MASIGIGLIGTGYMGKCHALAWNAVGPTFYARCLGRRIRRHRHALLQSQPAAHVYHTSCLHDCPIDVVAIHLTPVLFEPENASV